MLEITRITSKQFRVAVQNAWFAEKGYSLLQATLLFFIVWGEYRHPARVPDAQFHFGLLLASGVLLFAYSAAILAAFSEGEKGKSVLSRRPIKIWLYVALSFVCADVGLAIWIILEKPSFSFCCSVAGCLLVPATIILLRVKMLKKLYREVVEEKLGEILT